MKHLQTYKANRVYDDTFLGGPFFAKAYNDNLFQKGGATTIFSYPQLEADDCLAIRNKKHCIQVSRSQYLYYHK